MLLLSCSGKTTAPDKDMPISDFPNHIGTYWVYLIKDSVGYDTTTYMDTVRVTIVDLININKNEYTMVWEYEFNDFLDTQYVFVGNDTLSFSSDSFLSNGYYVFPLEVGSGWGRSNDTSYVVEKTSIVTRAGEFNNSFRVRRESYGSNYYFDLDTWLVNKVGIVVKEITIMSLGPPLYTRWELIEYDTRQ